MTTKCFIGVDIGGSHIGFGIVNDFCEIILMRHVGIDKSLIPATAVAMITETVRSMLSEIIADHACNFEVCGIGIGIPGLHMHVFLLLWHWYYTLICCRPIKGWNTLGSCQSAQLCERSAG